MVILVLLYPFILHQNSPEALLAENLYTKASTKLTFSAIEKGYVGLLAS